MDSGAERRDAACRFFRSDYWLHEHMKRPQSCPDASINPFRSSLHKLKSSGRKVVTPAYVSSSDMVKIVVGAPGSRLRTAVTRDLAAGCAAAELKQFLSIDLRSHKGEARQCIAGSQ